MGCLTGSMKDPSGVSVGRPMAGMTTLQRAWLAGFAAVSIWSAAAGYARQPIPDFTKADTIDLTKQTAIQMEVLRRTARYHIKEGMDHCAWHLTNQKGHGSEKRVPEVLQYLLEYGAHAKSTVPELPSTAAYLAAAPKGFPRELSAKMVAQVSDRSRSSCQGDRQDSTHGQKEPR